MRHILIVGAGAVGAAYGSMFYERDKGSVSFLADGERYGRLLAQGVRVNGKDYPISLQRPDSVPFPADLILVAVKHHHLSQAISDMVQAVGPDTVILSLMNGIDSEEEIAGVYGMEKVLYGMVLGIDAVRTVDGVTYSNQGRIFFGEAANRTLTKRVCMIKELFEATGIACVVPEDMIRTLWWKFMINVGINQASAALRAPYGLFQSSREAAILMESAMREVMSLAAKAGVVLSEEDIANWYAVLNRLSPEGKTSMLQDVEAGRKTEVEMFAGKVISLGKKYGVATPVNEELLRMITAIEAKF